LAKFSIRHPVRSLGQFVKKLLGGPERPEQPPKPPPPPPGGAPPIGPDLAYNDTRKAIWTEVTGEDEESPNGYEYWDLFLDTGAWIRRSYDMINRLWEDFLRAFWLTSSEPGAVPRDEWYDEADVDPSLIDWDRWREIKRTP